MPAVQDCLFGDDARIIGGSCRNTSDAGGAGIPSLDRRSNRPAPLPRSARLTRRQRKPAPPDISSRACWIRRTSREPCLTLHRKRCIGSSGIADSMSVQRSSLRRHQRSWRQSLTSICGGALNQVATNVSTRSASANGWRYWWTRTPPWPLGSLQRWTSASSLPGSPGAARLAVALGRSARSVSRHDFNGFVYQRSAPKDRNACAGRGDGGR